MEVSLSHVITERISRIPWPLRRSWEAVGKGASRLFGLSLHPSPRPERYDDGIVPFDRVAEPLFKGLETCLEWGVEFGGQATPVVFPPVSFAMTLALSFRGGASSSSERDFVYAPVCMDCSARDVVEGSKTLEKYGARGLTPLR